MNAEQYAAAERSALDKKLDPWGGALVGHQQYYLQHQQQDPAPSQESAHHHQHYNQQLQPGQQQQPAYHATISPREDGSLFQPDAPGTGFGNTHSTIFQASANAHNAGSFTMAHNIPPQPHTTRNAPSPAPLHLNSPPTDQMRTRPLPVSMTPPPLTPIRDHRNHKGSTVVSRSSHRPERFAPDIPAGRISNLAMVKSSSPHTGRRIRSTAMSAFTVRPTGTKDRHSKVRTAKGLRDRRVRLSAPTAIQFFDVQDRLGYDQPSKAVDWLIEKARAAIDELAPIQGMIIAGESTIAIAPAPQSRDVNHSCTEVKDEEQQRSIGIQVADPRAESRVKARERARERAKEKSTTTSPIPAATAIAATTTITTTTNNTSALSNTIAAISSFTTTPPFPSSPPNLHLLPEFLLMTSQFCQLPPPDHDMQRPLQPQDLASILPSPASASSATHLLPFASHFFPAQFAGSGAYFGDAPSMQISAPPILYSNMNNSTNSNIIPISPRGTLQSIFSNPTSSNTQAYTPQLPPVMMMGSLHAHAYGAAPLGSMGGCITAEARDHQQSSSHELGSPDLHQQVRIPMRIHGMKLGSQEESRITPPSSMEAEL